MLHTSSALAEDDEYTQAKPIKVWIYDSKECSRQTKNMNRLLDLWRSGKATPADISIAVPRPDGTVYAPFGDGLPYYTYKMHLLNTIETFGDIYYYGCPKEGVSASKSAAMEMYERAAIKHVPSAQFKLGRMQYEGDGVEKQEEIGLAWITSAAIEGSADAAQFLASINKNTPKPISPNSYAAAALEAKAIHEGLKQADRAKLVSDLASLSVNFATGYLTGIATQPTTNVPKVAKQPSSTTTPKATKPMLTMTQPTYCNYYVTTYSSEYSDTVSATVSKFCH